MKRLFSLMLAAIMALSLAACHKDGDISPSQMDTGPATAPVSVPETFPVLSNDVSITCVEGTKDCWRIDGDIITFSGLQADSLYTISGQWEGSIVILAGENHKLELEMQGLSLASGTASPITILSGNRVTLTAKKGFENFIYDKRPVVSEEEQAGAIHAECDLTIGGKGSLMIVSGNNNGIHTKDDLEVKNLTLTVSCADNALKGNDSVRLSAGNITLISRRGDGIKTSNSGISEKGKQRGTITLSGCTLTVFAACDGLDASYDVVIENDATVLNIYTDKYSDYSETVDAYGENSQGEQYYIRFPGDYYHFAVQYYNSDSDYQWVESTYHSTVSGGRESYVYYAFPIMDQYSKIRYFGYTSDQASCQDKDYAFCTDYLSVNTSYDTFAIYIRGNSLTYNWEPYSTQIGGGPGGRPGDMGGGPGGMGGGMQEGNYDKGSYSTKGIKAANAIYIYAGSVNIKSYDDAIHANRETTLENGASPLGNVTVSGGNITLYTNDDGIHADGAALVSGGTVNVLSAFEGVEGYTVSITGGAVSVVSKDDGINATATSGTTITISDGYLYIFACGDGIDSNSATSGGGALFSGGTTVVITASNGNSAIDTERGYQYTAGYVLAITSSGGMSHETTNLSNLAAVGKMQSMRLSSGEYVQVKMDSDVVLTVKMPCAVNALVVFLGDPDATITAASTVKADLDKNGVCWKH